MPEKLDRCVRAVMAQGRSEQSAFAICQAALGEADWPEDVDEATQAMALQIIDEVNAPEIETERERHLEATIARIFKRMVDAIMGEPHKDDDDDDKQKRMQNAAFREAGDNSRLGHLLEQAVRPDGTIAVKLIEPGWGTSGFYSSEVLARDGPMAFPARTQMFWNHDTDTEEAERPEGDLNSLAGILVTPAQWRETGPHGPGLYADAEVFSPYRDAVNELAPHIGVSIRARGQTHIGEANGRRGTIIDSIDKGRSVDFVAMAGAGGKILELFEAKRGLNTPVHKEREMTTEALTEANERIAKLEKLIEVERQARIAAQATTLVHNHLRDCGLPEAATARLREAITATPPLTEGGDLDSEALKVRVDEAVKTETAYLQAVAGVSPVTGMGGTSIDTERDYGQDIEEAFRSIGLSESAAKIAATGRYR